MKQTNKVACKNKTKEIVKRKFGKTDLRNKQEKETKPDNRLMAMTSTNQRVKGQKEEKYFPACPSAIKTSHEWFLL